MAVVLALLGAFTYGAGDFLGGLATKRIRESVGVVAVSSIVGVALIIVALTFTSGDATAADMAWGAGAGVAGGLGVMIFYRALAAGVMSIVAPVTAVTSTAIPVAAGLALGERPSALALAGVALAIVAVALLSRETPGAREQGAPLRVVLPSALLAGVGFGGFFVLIDQTGDDAGLWPLVASRSTTLVLVTLIALATHRSLGIPRGARAATVGTGVLDMAANTFFLLATREGLLALVSVIVSLYPASTIALAQIVLGERLERHQVVGVVAAGVAVTMIAAG
jgi:drug/metabolite transporter (DMT)-like permease